MSYQALPTYETPLVNNGKTNSVWYRFLQGLFKGIPSGGEVSVTVGTSPFTYTAPSGGTLIVQGGTVSLTQFTRNHTTNYTTGQTAGMFPLRSGDSLIVTYSALPAMTFVPN